MIKEQIKYTFNDLQIEPDSISLISHREECEVTLCNENGEMTLPLFTAPMSTVVSLENAEIFKKNLINPIIPRNVDFSKRMEYMEKTNGWAAFSLSEFEDAFVKKNNIEKYENINKFHVLIDIANGHMSKLYSLCEKAKDNFPNLRLMVGNIANPNTYKYCCMEEIDYVRVGIGTGMGCLTATQTAVSYPQASLINDTYEIKKYLEKNSNYNNFPYIVSDGGIRGYSDIIKALALGADYVMCGSIFSKMLESSGQIYANGFPVKLVDGKLKHYSSSESSTDGIRNHYELPLGNIKKLLDDKILTKTYYGMSTKQAQLETGRTKLHTSEGTFKELPIEYTMSQWCDNFKDYLRSAMSYCGFIHLKDFIGGPSLNPITENAYNSINK